MTEQITANPPYPSKHHGIAVVVGSAPVALDELSTVISRLSARPYVIAINDMGIRIECDAIVSCHPSLMATSSQDHPATLHHYPSNQSCRTVRLPYVDHVWSGPSYSAGSSSLPAALIAKAIGFKAVILCGVPLTRTGYLEGYPGQHVNEFRLVEPSGKNTPDINGRLEAWSSLARKGGLKDVYSMSGYTEKLLGFPSALLDERRAS